MKKQTHVAQKQFWLQAIYITIFCVCVWGILNVLGEVDLHALKNISLSKMNFGKSVLCKDCNILLISFDTLSANHLPCYGYFRDTAPNLCKFAKENILFTNSFAQSDWTLPSHFSIFTSLYPSIHQVLGEYEDELNSQYFTLQEVLQKYGYGTHFFGNTQNANIPLDKGFGRGFTDFHKQGSSGEDFDEAINRFIADAKYKKTFAFIHSMYVHDPYYPGDESTLIFTKERFSDIPLSEQSFNSESNLEKFYPYVEDYVKKNILPLIYDQKVIDAFHLFCQETDIKKKKQIFDYLVTINSLFNDLSNHYSFDILYNGKSEYIKTLYDEQIYNLDKTVIQSLTRLINEIPTKTIIIITADHGEAFMEHGVFAHQNLYSEIQRVPLIMYIPGFKNLKIDSLIQGIDLFPTILDIVGVPYDTMKIEGKSQACLSLCKQDQLNPYVISEIYKEKGRSIVTIDRRWKLYAHNVDATDSAYMKIELFDVIKDPGDKKNIAAEHNNIVSEKMKIIQSFINRPALPILLLPIPTRTPDSIEKERREKINYFHY